MFFIQKKKKRKTVAESAICQQKIELFTDAHLHELVFGGRVLQVVSKYASIVAKNHANANCENIGIDFVRFFSPVKRGDILTCKAAVNNTWESVIEVGIKVIAEDFSSLIDKKVLSAYFTFSAVDENQSPIIVPDIIPETNDEMRRHADAEKRQLQRKKTYSDDCKSRINL